MITELHDYAQDTKGTIKQETKKHATCFATLLQNELNSDVARFTTNKKNLATLFTARQFRTWIEKRTILLFNVAQQVHVLCCSFYCSLNHQFGKPLR